MSDEFLNENINSYEGEEENKYDDYDNSEINNTDLNGEYENKLFRTYTQARQFMESCIKIEMSVQESENHCSGMLERVGDNMANLWLNTDYSEGVTYRISKVSPI